MSLSWTGSHKYRDSFLGSSSTSNSDYGNWFGRSGSTNPAVTSHPVTIPTFRRAGLTRKYHSLNSPDPTQGSHTAADKNGNQYVQDIHAPRVPHGSYTKEHVEVIDLTPGSTKHLNGLHPGSNHRNSPDDYSRRYTGLHSSQTGNSELANFDAMDNIPKSYGSRNDLSGTSSHQSKTHNVRTSLERSHTTLGNQSTSPPVPREGSGRLRTSLQRSVSFTSGERAYNYRPNTELWNSQGPRPRGRNMSSKYMLSSSPDSNTAQGVLSQDRQLSNGDQTPYLGPRSHSYLGEISASQPWASSTDKRHLLNSSDLKSNEPYMYQSMSAISPDLDTSQRSLTDPRFDPLRAGSRHSEPHPGGDSYDLGASTNSFTSHPPATDKRAKKSILKKRSQSLDRQARSSEAQGRELCGMYLFSGYTWNGSQQAANLPPLSATMDLPKRSSGKRVTFAV